MLFLSATPDGVGQNFGGMTLYLKNQLKIEENERESFKNYILR